MRPSSCRWAIGGGFQVAVADPDSSWRQRHCPHTPHYAQQQSGGESERPRNCRSFLQGGPRKALFRSSWDWTWQLWCCIFCKYFDKMAVLAQSGVAEINEWSEVLSMCLWRTFLRIRNVLLNRFKHGPKKGAMWMCFSLSHLLHNILEDSSYVAWRVILRNSLVLFPFLFFFFFSKWRLLFYKTSPLHLSIYFRVILRISSNLSFSVYFEV